MTGYIVCSVFYVCISLKFVGVVGRGQTSPSRHLEIPLGPPSTTHTRLPRRDKVDDASHRARCHVVHIVSGRNLLPRPRCPTLLPVVPRCVRCCPLRPVSQGLVGVRGVCCGRGGMAMEENGVKSVYTML